MVKCSVPGCSSSRAEGKGTWMHVFPKDIELINQWCSLIHRNDILQKGIWKTSRVCDLHFDEESKFPQYRKRSNLMYGTLPSLLLPTSPVSSTDAVQPSQSGSSDLNRCYQTCPVVGCQNSVFNEKSTYFPFPKRLTSFEQWLEVINNPALQNLTYEQIRGRYAMCSRHFDDDQYRDLVTLCDGVKPQLYLDQHKDSGLDDVENTDERTCGIPEVQCCLGEASDNDDTNVTEGPNNESRFLISSESDEQLHQILKSVESCGESVPVNACRICLTPALSSIRLSSENFTKTMVEFVLPELDMDIYPDPIICEHCEEQLRRAYDFKKLWWKSERVLRQFFTKSPEKQSSVDDLEGDMLTYEAERRSDDESASCQAIIAGDHDYALVQTSSGEHNYAETTDGIVENSQATVFFERKKCPVPDPYNILDAQYDEYFLRNEKYALLRRQLRKVKRPDRGEPPYLCHVCGRVINSHEKYLIHAYNHRLRAKLEPFVCDICGLLIKNTSFRVHYHTHNPGEYVCRLCDRSFDKKVALVMHLKWKHLEKERERLKQCHLCGKRFPKLAKHLLTHSRVQCHVCQKDVSEGTIKIHMKFHCEGRSKCPVCSKVVNHLRNHMMLMHEKKKFKCDDCGREFHARYLLKNHLAKFHDKSSKPV